MAEEVKNAIKAGDSAATRELKATETAAAATVHEAVVYDIFFKTRTLSIWRAYLFFRAIYSGD